MNAAPSISTLPMTPTRQSLASAPCSQSAVKRINNFSGGLCSFWSAWRDVQEVGPENVVLLFADTLVESPELYEFQDAASDLLGVPVTRISAGITPWQLFRREKMIGNNKYPLCSIYLKRELLDAWMVSHYEMDQNQENMFLEKASLSLGFDWTEEHRVKAMRQDHPTWDIRAPMMEEPLWDKCKMQSEAEKLGLPVSSAYKLGLPHDNCGGRCVRAGISHWVRLLEIRPEAYREWEVEEQETAASLGSEGIEPLSMLKDRRGGVTRNLYLTELRQRVESGEKFSRHDWGGCGCGGAVPSIANTDSATTDQPIQKT
jgi:hypothetical protein